MKKHSIVIIGGGIAGLYAAWLLSPHYNVTLLEANSYMGGRAHSSNEPGFSGIVEYGAEFIHGDAQQTFALLKEAGIKYEKMKGKMYRREKSELVVDNEMIEDWDELMQRMKEVHDEMTLQDFLTTYFADEKYAQLRKQAESYAAGFDLADIRTVTAKSLYKEWSSEAMEMYHIPSGYGALVQYIANRCIENGCTIITDTAVKQMVWKKSSIQAKCANSKVYEAERALITIPVSMLQTNGIQFIPDIPLHLNEIKNIGWGYVIKVQLEFDEAFWKDDISFIFSEQEFPTWWTQLPDERPLFTGWVGGVKAKELSVLPDEELKTKALASLGTLLDIPATQLERKLVASKVLNWQREKWVTGGYCFSIPGTEKARELLCRPIDDTIYFAGEGFHRGPHPGTVEGALLSAKEAAGNILGSI